MKFVDNAPIEGPRMTSDGYLVADVRVARTGIQQYLARELGLNKAGVVNVYRPEETVFSIDSMSTFAGKPVTMNHPSEPVTAENWKQYAIGDIGTEIARDGDYIRVPIKLMDASAINAVKSGVRELSMGYSVDVVLQDGIAPDGTPYQAIQSGHLKINHLAVVPKARGGENLRIGDSADTWGAAPIYHSDTERKPDVSESLRTVVVGDEAVQVTDAAARIIESLKGELRAKDVALADAKVSADAKDIEIGSLKAELQVIKDSVPTDEKVRQLVADRVSLEVDAAKIDPSLDLRVLSDAEIRQEIVSKKLGTDIIDGASEAEIAGMFKAIVKDAKPVDPVREVLKNRVAVDAATADNGQNKYEERLKSAWKSV